MRYIVLLFLFVTGCSFGQTGPTAAEAAAAAVKKTVMDAVSAGTPLRATINVADNVNVEAVMLPEGIVRRVFGGEVAKSYAVIEVNISNRSNDAALILHSLFIDMSGWGLAGPLVQAPPEKLKGYEAKASANEIASVEYRIVRGQMQDAQPTSKRNITITAVEVLGSIGTAFAFPFSKDIVAGIGAWNGAVAPGLAKLWPDGMNGQINRISDYGFRNNKIIAQQSADIVIAFFPIDRFLNATLRPLFLKSPAVFFNPFLLAIDPKSSQLLMPFLERALDVNPNDALKELVKGMAKLDQQALAQHRNDLANAQSDWETSQKLLTANEQVVDRDDSQIKHADPKDLAKLKTMQAARESDFEILDASRTLHQRHAAALKAAQDALASDLASLKAKPLYNLFTAMSLNNVHITVTGIMTVDELTIPATIEGTCFEKAGPEMWAVAGDKECSVSGRFLGNGTPRIADAASLGIAAITVNKDASTSELLKFTFKLKAPLKSPVNFDLVVAKEGKNGKPSDSMVYHVTSSYTLPGPTIVSVTRKDKIYSVTGNGFYSGPNNEFSVALRQQGHDDIPETVAAPATSTQFDLDIGKPAMPAPGCYAVAVSVGTREAVSNDANQIRVAASPAIASVSKADATHLNVAGTELIDTQACGGTAVAYQVLDDKQNVLASTAVSKGTEALLTLTAADVAKAKSVRLQGEGGAGTAIK